MRRISASWILKRQCIFPTDYHYYLLDPFWPYKYFHVSVTTQANKFLSTISPSHRVKSLHLSHPTPPPLSQRHVKSSTTSSSAGPISTYQRSPVDFSPSSTSSTSVFGNHPLRYPPPLSSSTVRLALVERVSWTATSC